MANEGMIADAIKDAARAITLTGANINIADAIDKSANALGRIAEALQDLCLVIKDKEISITVNNEGE